MESSNSHEERYLLAITDVNLYLDGIDMLRPHVNCSNVRRRGARGVSRSFPAGWRGGDPEAGTRMSGGVEPRSSRRHRRAGGGEKSWRWFIRSHKVIRAAAVPEIISQPRQQPPPPPGRGQELPSTKMSQLADIVLCLLTQSSPCEQQFSCLRFLCVSSQRRSQVPGRREGKVSHVE